MYIQYIKLHLCDLITGLHVVIHVCFNNDKNVYKINNYRTTNPNVTILCYIICSKRKFNVFH